MKIFSTFTGIGGFEIGIQNAFDNRPYIRNGSEALHGNSTNASESEVRTVGYSEIDKYAIKVYEKQFGGECENCRLARKRECNSGTYGRQETLDSERTRLSQDDRDNDDIKNERSEGGRITCEHTPKNYGDITKINADELPDFDCLVGGFPCQAFSIAGKRKGFEDTRGTLFFDLARILRAKQPRLFVFENVKGLLSHDSGRTFKTIIQTIDELGYDCQWQVLNSKNHGVPQNRERIYIVGHLRGTPRPEVFPITGDGGADTRLPGHVSNTLTARYEGAQAVGTYIGESKLNAQASIKVPEATKKGYAEATIGQAINLSVPNSKTRRGRVSDIAPTRDTGMQLHTLTDDVRIRRLTPVECERLQGFPDQWTAEGIDGPISDTQRYKMCGNAVTTNVVQAVFDRIFELTMEAKDDQL